jgi:hypothetical protein
MVQREENPIMPQRALQKRLSMKSAPTAQPEYPPRACAEVVFCFDDDGMEYTDGYEGGEA